MVEVGRELAAAKIATRAGCSVVLARGVEPHPLARLETGGPCTRFPARANPRRARKEWLAATLGVMGVIRIDAGAARALKRGSSLLPVGITEVEGEFEAGDAVDVASDGKTIGKGIVNYSAEELRRIKGLRTEKVRELLPHASEEAVHRDYFVLT